MSRWRVTAKGRTAATRDADHPLWEEGEMANAHLWAERVVPDSGFAVERFGTQRPKGESVASVTMTVRVSAVDASEAERTVRVLFEQAMPRVTFSQILAEQITGRHVSGVHPEPMCSFCGQTQRQAKKLIAGPGVYICDECVEMMVEIIQEEAPPPSG
jgi:hypothetical protein